MPDKNCINNNSNFHPPGGSGNILNDKVPPFPMGNNPAVNRGNPVGRGGGPKETATDFPKTVGKLIRYTKAYIPLILLALLLSCVGIVFSVIGPSKIGEITDLITKGIETGIDFAAISRIGLYLVGLYGIGFVFSYAQSVIMAFVAQRITKGLRSDLSQKINRLPLWYLDKMSYGNILSRVTNDVDTVGTTLGQSLASLVSSTVLFVGVIAMMLSISGIMTLTALVSIALGFVVLIVVMVVSQKFFVDQQNYLGELGGHIEEIYSGQSIVRVYNGVEDAKSTFQSINNKLAVSAWKSQFITGMMMPFISFIDNLGYVAVCVVGAALALKGHITFGVIVAFMLYARLVIQPLGELSQGATGLQSAVAAGERIFTFLEAEELPEETGNPLPPQRVKGNIDFEQVTFGYLPGKAIIQNFSLRVKAGQKLAIVGPTGGGKTTLVNLLMRFYEPEGGSIRLDGTSYKDLKTSDVRKSLCMVLQDTWLFEGTIRENIVYSKKGVTDKQLISVCKAVGLHHFIKTLPDGYDTLLDERASLSQGQKQLITVARAMVKNAPLLILDEATSSVDTRTELLVQNAMDTLMEGRTSFVIAHRLSTIRNADLILVMKDGDIVESGTHKALLDEKGFYAQLYNSQFEQEP